MPLRDDSSLSEGERQRERDGYFDGLKTGGDLLDDDESECREMSGRTGWKRDERDQE